MTSGDGWEHYFYPGTGVLKNKLDLRDHAALTQAETALTALRTASYADHNRPATFDFDTFAAIHRWLFQDIYDWAGQLRTGPRQGVMTKAGHAYLPWSRLCTAIDYQFGLLRDDGYLQDVGGQELVDKLAFHWAEINMIHPFREGNTRTQLLFFDQLLARAGCVLELEKLRFGQPEREEFIEARFEAMRTADSARLARLLATIVHPV